MGCPLLNVTIVTQQSSNQIDYMGLLSAMIPRPSINLNRQQRSVDTCLTWERNGLRITRGIKTQMIYNNEELAMRLGSVNEDDSDEAMFYVDPDGFRHVITNERMEQIIKIQEWRMKRQQARMEHAERMDQLRKTNAVHYSATGI